MRAVVVHRGARDAYQVARALSENCLLEALVTDLYWPAERLWVRGVESLFPASAQVARRRWAGESLDGAVRQCWASGIGAFALEKARLAPFGFRRQAIRWSDSRLGYTAGRLATRRGSALLSYSYYAYDAFSAYSGEHPRILFQLHPHPAVVREILRNERALHPECRSGLEKEWELCLPDDDFNRLVEETTMADHWIVASTFSRDSLTAQGLPPERIHVIPYGVDTRRFFPRAVRAPSNKLRLLFVGTITQRKGIKYLLEAIELLPDEVELKICGRVVDDLTVFSGCGPRVQVCPSVSSEALLEAFQTADIFAFPSLAEGFGHVILEAMACGLPVIATSRTAARDLIRDGQEGFIIEPGDAQMLASRIRWFLTHRDKLPEMQLAARQRAEQFTWALFRYRVAQVVGTILNQSAEANV